MLPLDLRPPDFLLCGRCFFVDCAVSFVIYEYPLNDSRKTIYNKNATEKVAISHFWGGFFMQNEKIQRGGRS